MNADRLRSPLRAACLALAGLALGSGVAACPSGGVSAADPGSAWEAEFAQAQADYEANRWQAAYERLGRLADRGHTEAARIALQMWRYAEPLYGTRFDAAPARRAQWAAAALSCRLA